MSGIDGCRAGWIAVTIAAAGPIHPSVTVTRHFADLVAGMAVVAVDMPIGLPERTGRGGRGPESLVRPLLGGRQSSVFSIPARAAVEAPDYLAACRAALATSDPPRKVSKQAFCLFAKVREVDGLLRADPDLAARVHEMHPEVAFWQLNGQTAVPVPKKVKSRIHPPGMAFRRGLLVAAGFPEAFLADVPRGAGADDLLDAAAGALVARRIRAGQALSFPDPPGRDAHGLPVAIRA
ncbi:DUF429 domain-containing protein [Phreatobacter sp.]|uniref:DUF429 domain-containing protein n=1 Tax=Phreatobacter sp. TaxID=1966341 RepID=UPI003F7183B7